jgi:hypothetical protein
MSRDSFTKKKNDFFSYLKTKNLTQKVYRRFYSDFLVHIKENREDFLSFYDFINSVSEFNLDKSVDKLNYLIKRKRKGYVTASFVSDWSFSYVGAGEIICLLINSEATSGRKRLPDIIIRKDDKKIEIKSYSGGFRLTESTSFFTDLGTIIQALVQGGFLNSLTEINNNELRKGLRHFGEAFLCKRGFIELQGEIWKIESKSKEQIVFTKSPDTEIEIVKYSMVRNSLRNWLGRGTLSIQLSNIIDPNRKNKISKKEIQEYVKNILGYNERIPIPLEQYFHLCSLNYMIIYDRTLDNPFAIIKEENLKDFKLERITQAKVTYTRI